MHLPVLRPRVGGQATHRILTVTCNVCPQGRDCGPQDGTFDTFDRLCCPEGREFDSYFSSEKSQNPHPHA